MSKFKILNDSIKIELLSAKKDNITITLFIPKPFFGSSKSKDFDDSNYGLYINNLFTGFLLNIYDYGVTISVGVLGFKVDIWWSRNII